MTSDPLILKPCVIRVQSCCIDLSRNGLMTGENGEDGQNAQKKLLQFVESSLELIMEPQIGIVESKLHGKKSQAILVTTFLITYCIIRLSNS